MATPSFRVSRKNHPVPDNLHTCTAHHVDLLVATCYEQEQMLLRMHQPFFTPAIAGFVRSSRFPGSYVSGTSSACFRKRLGRYQFLRVSTSFRAGPSAKHTFFRLREGCGICARVAEYCAIVAVSPVPPRPTKISFSASQKFSFGSLSRSLTPEAEVLALICRQAASARTGHQRIVLVPHGFITVHLRFEADAVM